MLEKSKVKINEKFINHPLFNEPVCGTNFGFMAKRGYYASEEALKQPELMKNMGVNWTTLNQGICQDRYYSDKVYLDFELSSGELELSEMSKRLHDNGIHVMLKHNLTLLDGAWMGYVQFPEKAGLSQIANVDNDYWGKWFKSFKESIKYSSDLAERIGADAIILGAELFGTEGQDEYWRDIIKTARDNFSNPVSYEFTCASRKAYKLDWINELDFLSYSYYPPASKPNFDIVDQISNPGAKDMPNRSIDDMKNYLEPRKKRILSISERFNNLPIVFSEFGVRSAHGCSMRPENFLWDTPYDGIEQANYMQAGIETFSSLPNWMGFFWWKWDETQIRPQYHNDPNGDRGFTIQGKPAEEVFKKWAKSRQNQKNKKSPIFQGD